MKFFDKEKKPSSKPPTGKNVTQSRWTSSQIAWLILAFIGVAALIVVIPMLFAGIRRGTLSAHRGPESCSNDNELPFLFNVQPMLSELPDSPQQSSAETMAAISSSTINTLPFESQNFIARQTRIRVVLDMGPNFGNQATTFDVMRALRKDYHFNGIYEVIYPAGILPQLRQMLGRWDIENENFSITDLLMGEMHFVTYKTHSSSLANGEVEPIELGLTGQSDESRQFADAYRTRIFIRPYAYTRSLKNTDGSEQPCDTQLYIEGNSDALNLSGSCDLPFVMPITSLQDAEDYLQTTQGQHFAAKNPAIRKVGKYLTTTQATLFAAYGSPLRLPENMLNLILGIAEAQERLQFTKPAIIFGFSNLLSYPLKSESYIDKNGQKKSRPLFTLQDWLSKRIHHDDWQDDSEYPNVNLLREEIKRLGLARNLTFIPWDEKLFYNLRRLNKGQIAIVELPKMPKVLFDAFYITIARRLTQGLPGLAVREGAGTLNNGLTDAGVPHLRFYGKNSRYDIYYPNAPALIQAWLEALHQNITLTRESRHKFNYQNHLIADFISKSFDPDSDVSQYFKAYAEYARNPKNQRLAQALEAVVDALNTEFENDQSQLSTVAKSF